MKKTLGQLVIAAREAKGWNQSELAKATGLSQPTVSAIESDTTQAADIKLNTMLRLVGATGRPLSYFLGADDPLVDVTASGNAVPVNPQYRSRLPLISFVHAGMRGDANDPYAPGVAEMWVEFESQASSGAFCLRVRGYSMVRADGTGFPEGCVIAVDPARRPRSGDFVVVRFNDSDEATFKQYFVDGPLKLLKPLNPDFPTLHVTPDAAICGVVFEKRIVEKY